LHNIKSKYILQQIFKNLEYEKKLKIIKYNKKLQEKLNVNVNDYEKYLQIEIEVLFMPISFYILYKNIRIINMKNNPTKYYHIYLDDNINEIERNYINKEDIFSKIKIKIDYEVKALNGLFKDNQYITSINFVKFKRKDITNIRNMFGGCVSLQELDVSKLYTNNITDMSYLFYQCSSITKLNLSHFNTSNVTNMQFMFYGCTSLKDLNIFNIELIYQISIQLMLQI